MPSMNVLSIHVVVSYMSKDSAKTYSLQTNDEFRLPYCHTAYCSLFQLFSVVIHRRAHIFARISHLMMLLRVNFNDQILANIFETNREKCAMFRPSKSTPTNFKTARQCG